MPLFLVGLLPSYSVCRLPPTFAHRGFPGTPPPVPPPLPRIPLVGFPSTPLLKASNHINSRSAHQSIQPVSSHGIATQGFTKQTWSGDYTRSNSGQAVKLAMKKGRGEGFTGGGFQLIVPAFSVCFRLSSPTPLVSCQ